MLAARGRPGAGARTIATAADPGHGLQRPRVRPHRAGRRAARAAPLRGRAPVAVGRPAAPRAARWLLRRAGALAAPGALVRRPRGGRDRGLRRQGAHPDLLRARAGRRPHAAGGGHVPLRRPAHPGVAAARRAAAGRGAGPPDRVGRPLPARQPAPRPRAHLPRRAERAGARHLGAAAADLERLGVPRGHPVGRGPGRELVLAARGPPQHPPHPTAGRCRRARLPRVPDPRLGRPRTARGPAAPRRLAALGAAARAAGRTRTRT